MGGVLKKISLKYGTTVSEFLDRYPCSLLTVNSRIVRPPNAPLAVVFDRLEDVLFVVAGRQRGGASYENDARGFHDNNRDAAEARIPSWNGDPATFLKFETAVVWWFEGEDLGYYTRIGVNLAARFVRKQSGLARAKAEEYLPSQLRGTPAVLYTHQSARADFPDAEEEDIVAMVGTVQVEADPTAGIRLLLDCYRQSIGRDPPHRRQELRDEYYRGCVRKRNEPVINFLSAHRALLSKMKLEGIAIDEEQVVYYLRSKLALSETQLQLLDIACGPEPTLAEIEAQVTRLFKRIHTSTFGSSATTTASSSSLASRPMLRRFMGSQSGRSSAPSSRYSASASSSGRSSTGRFQRPFRRANVAEYDEAAEGEEVAAEEVEQSVCEEWTEDHADDDASLAEDPDDEWEVNAAAILEDGIAELEAAAEAGLEDSVLADLESKFEGFASALVTLKESRQRTASNNKDRRYGRVSSGTGSGGPPDKTKSKCFDCGESGHWSGDAGCKKPGAGLFKPSASDNRPSKGAGKFGKGGKARGKGNQARNVTWEGSDEHEAFTVSHSPAQSETFLVASKQSCSMCQVVTSASCGNCGQPLCGHCSQYRSCECQTEDGQSSVTLALQSDYGQSPTEHDIFQSHHGDLQSHDAATEFGVPGSSSGSALQLDQGDSPDGVLQLDHGKKTRRRRRKKLGADKPDHDALQSERDAVNNNFVFGGSDSAVGTISDGRGYLLQPKCG